MNNIFEIYSLPRV